MFVTGCVILRTIPCCSNSAHCLRSGPAQMHRIVLFPTCDHARFHTRVAVTSSCHQIHQVLQMAATLAHDSRGISPTAQTNTEGPSPSFSPKAHIRSAPAFSYLGEVGRQHKHSQRCHTRQKPSRTNTDGCHHICSGR